MKAAMVGFGDLGQQVLPLALSNFSFEEVIVFDDTYSEGRYQKFPFSEYSSALFSDFQFFVSLGYKNLSLKRRIVNELLAVGRKLPTLIHSTSFINPSVVISPAVYVYPMCNIDKGVTLKAGTLLNNSVTVSHDCVIGEASYLSPGVILSGNVKIGAEVFLGSNSVVANGIFMGDRSLAGIGTCISQNVNDGNYVVGNPMKIVTKIDLH